MIGLACHWICHAIQLLVYAEKSFSWLWLLSVFYRQDNTPTSISPGKIRRIVMRLCDSLRSYF
jgi:hypothetical protein